MMKMKENMLQNLQEDSKFIKLGKKRKLEGEYATLLAAGRQGKIFLDTFE